MKRLIALLCAALVMSGCAAQTNQPGGQTGECSTLKVFNVGEYIGQDVIAKFEKQFKVKVVYDLFASNEEMYTKLLSGESYDIIVPSDYMIERMILENRLQKLDWSKIPNRENLIAGLQNQQYDPQDEYSAPYFWGTVGIIYDSTKVDQAEVERQGWNIFRDTKYSGRIYFYDSERDAFMMALKSLGYSMNTNDPAQIDEAYNWLRAMSDTMAPVYVTDEVIDYMISGVKDMAYVYSGDATYMISENPDLKFWTPEEGTNLWTDAMVVPANAKCPALAYEWINFMLSDEISEENTLYVGYASSNQAVFDQVSTDEEEGYGGIDAYIPRLGYEKDEVFHYDEAQRKKVSELWTLIKAEH